MSVPTEHLRNLSLRFLAVPCYGVKVTLGEELTEDDFRVLGIAIRNNAKASVLVGTVEGDMVFGNLNFEDEKGRLVQK